MVRARQPVLGCASRADHVRAGAPASSGRDLTLPYDVDLVVVGAGLIGLATAREVVIRRPGMRVLVLEKEAQIASHQSGHNSGVIHSGIYYQPGSLKARLCIRGGALLRTFCDAHGIAHPEPGKLIVAVREHELTRLDNLKQRGDANGLRGLELIEGTDIARIEPAARGLRAVFSPATGIVDYGLVASGLAADIAAGGGVILTDHRVTGLRRLPGSWTVATTQSTITARRVVTCAGLQSDRLAALTGGAREPRIVPFRGEYSRLRPGRERLVRGLIYPVPDPAFPFLGVHFTRRVDGTIWIGPNALLALAKEGYRRSRVSVRELASLLTWPGFYRMARRYRRMGFSEFGLALNQGAFIRELQRYLPALQPGDVLPAGAGVRAQAVAADGRLLDDFAFAEEEGILHVRNAPSPAATACLAIAETIVDRLER